MPSLQDKIRDARFSELGDVITKRVNKPLHQLPFQDIQQDLDQIISGQRSFGQSFDNAVIQLKEQGLSPVEIAQTIIARQRLAQNPIAFRGITRKPTFEEKNIRGIQNILGGRI